MKEYKGYLNRNGAYSNGYFGSSDMCEDLYIEDNGKMGDGIAWDLGVCVYVLHRIISNIRTECLKVRRWYQT